MGTALTAAILAGMSESSGGGQSNEKNFELIETITVTEENTASIEKSTEPDGKAYNFEKVYVELALEASNAVILSIILDTFITNVF